ncbi:hypothetical protein HK405_005459 [Cladochytrium tenue]|nr:hypothetical protein HK405_005459 [Cladochytrium tenue]
MGSGSNKTLSSSAAAVTAAAPTAEASAAASAAASAPSFFEERDIAAALLTDVARDAATAVARAAATANASAGTATHNGQDSDSDARLRPLAEILDRYQEQPNLLDPHLEALVAPLVAVMRDTVAVTATDFTEFSASGSAGEVIPAVLEACKPVFRVFYLLCKVRGYKTVGDQ